METDRHPILCNQQKLDLARSDDSSEDINITERNEIGTQTKFIRRRSKGQFMPSLIFRKCLSTGIKQISPLEKPKKRKIVFMDWKKFHKLHVIYSFMDELERDFPAICTISVIGKSVEGRDIKMLKISNSKASNPAVWLDAAIHSREWISTAVVTYLADTIVRNFQHLSTSITNKDWYLVPVLNPDGYEYTHTRDRMWRKNRARQDGKCVGVDLNRNFSCGWGNNGDEGSSALPKHVFYRGPCPFSEPETAAVRDTILGSPTPFKVFLSFHSYFELIIFPWGYETTPCPDYLQLLEGGAVMARVTSPPGQRPLWREGEELRPTMLLKCELLGYMYPNNSFKLSDLVTAIYDSSGMIYKVGCTKDLTYYACGTSTDWSYAMAKIPYSYMIELRSKKHKFKLPKDQIVETCVEIWNAVKGLMDFVDQPRNKKENLQV